MRRLQTIAAALAAAHLAWPAAAIPPPIPVDHDYYGPVRACGGYYAFDVRAGEGYGYGGGPPLFLRFPGGGIGFETFLYEFERDRDIVHPLGTIDLEDGTRLLRIRMTSRNSSASEIIYLYEIPVSSWRPYLSIRSSSFDGSERDRPLLRRIAFGEAARALCASIPDELRPTPERENPDAAIYDPRDFAGPLTICMRGLAFDVPVGTTAKLPWTASWPRFRLTRGGARAEVDLLQWQPFQDAPPAEPLASSRRIELIEGRVFRYEFAPDDPQGPRHVLLAQRDPDGVRRSAIMPMAVFAFDPSIERAERLATARRLRVREPSDSCFSPPPLPAPEIGAATRA